MEESKHFSSRTNIFTEGAMIKRTFPTLIMFLISGNTLNLSRKNSPATTKQNIPLFSSDAPCTNKNELLCHFTRAPPGNDVTGEPSVIHYLHDTSEWMLPRNALNKCSQRIFSGTNTSWTAPFNSSKLLITIRSFTIRSFDIRSFAIRSFVYRDL